MRRRRPTWSTFLREATNGFRVHSYVRQHGEPCAAPRHFIALGPPIRFFLAGGLASQTKEDSIWYNADLSRMPPGKRGFGSPPILAGAPCRSSRAWIESATRRALVGRDVGRRDAEESFYGNRQAQHQAVLLLACPLGMPTAVQRSNGSCRRAVPPKQTVVELDRWRSEVAR